MQINNKITLPRIYSTSSCESTGNLDVGYPCILLFLWITSLTISGKSPSEL